MSIEEFTVAMGYLISAYPAAAFSSATSNLYFEHLKDIPFAIMEKAAARVVETSHFFPSVAELREECLKVERPEYIRNPVEAIELLNKSILTYGRYRPKEALEYIKSQDFILYNIVKAIRFVNVCNSDLRSYRTELERLYAASAEDMKKSNLLTGRTMSQILQLGNKIEYQALAMQSDDF